MSREDALLLMRKFVVPDDKHLTSGTMAYTCYLRTDGCYLRAPQPKVYPDHPGNTNGRLRVSHTMNWLGQRPAVHTGELSLTSLAARPVDSPRLLRVSS